MNIAFIKKIVLSITILIITFKAVGYEPPPGGTELDEFLNAEYLSQQGRVTNTKSPSAGRINPASAAFTQGFSFNGSYIGFVGFSGISGESGLRGHAMNVSFSLPKRYGVFTLGGGFLMLPFQEMNLGYTGNINFTFSKQFNDNMSLGVGLDSYIGYLDRFDIGIMMNIGFLHFPELPMNDFKWGIALKNLGKFYDPSIGASGIDRSPFPPPFTPVTGFSFKPIVGEKSFLELSVDTEFPSFQNIILRTGATISIAGFLNIHTAWNVDIKEVADPTLENRSLIPSIGFSLNFNKPESTESKKEFNFAASARPFYSQIWGFGTGVDIISDHTDKKSPLVKMDYRQVSISPNNDGISDDVVIPISITDEEPIQGYRFRVYSSDGTLYRTIENKEKRLVVKDVDTFLDSFLTVDKGIPIPESIYWDGTDNNGKVLPDGEYIILLESWDQSGNIGTSKEHAVIIDSTAPEITIIPPRQEELLFSPDGDNRKDTVMIMQQGSFEEEWRAVIESSNYGKTILEKNWHGIPPTQFSWDGKDENGILQQDGIYRYRISSRDAAGNETIRVVENIILRSHVPIIELKISRKSFSPNGDGVYDILNLIPFVSSSHSEVNNWIFRIKDESEKILIEENGYGYIPDKFTFNGLSNDGVFAGEGEYKAYLAIEYKNGGIAETESPSFFIDITPPAASVKSNYGIFSPDGDNERDGIVFYNESSVEEIWVGKITDEEGKTVKTFRWNNTAEPRVSWTGRTDKGAIAEDGKYFYQLTATDKGGNTGKSEQISFIIDTSRTPVVATASAEAFSPDSDGRNDTIQFNARLSKSKGREEEIVSTSWEIANAENTVVWSRIDPENFISDIIWRGTDSRGIYVNDGEYIGTVTITWKNGSKTQASTNFIRVDTEAPNVSLLVKYSLFSPNEDGRKDTVSIIQKTSREDQWEAQIKNSEGKLVRKYFWSQIAPNLIWDGTDSAGNVVPDGRYAYSISAMDAAGNTGSATYPEIIVDNRKVSLFITVDKNGLSPNGDGIADTVTFTTYTTIPEHVNKWNIEIRNENGDTVRSYSGNSINENRTFSWDGRDKNGKIHEGIYRVHFAAVYDKGDEPKTVSSPFILDVTPPSLKLSAAPTPFSPDNDDEDDEIKISVSVADISKIASWKMNIIDQNNHLFKTFSGKGSPTREIMWDGLSDDGNLVNSAEDYPYQFIVTDNYGNTSQKIGLIPVDILVIRDGNKLKVRIQNINFQPDSPRLIVDPASKEGRKNQKILRRLVEIFTKYNEYSIQIEGHAVNVTGTEREEIDELQPLSLARARMVEEALITLGLSDKRITAVGMGGKDPIVPHSDIENRWKNRRVEFILVK
jgi:flagellar hook assembly protein FlgD